MMYMSIDRILSFFAPRYDDEDGDDDAHSNHAHPEIARTEQEGVHVRMRTRARESVKERGREGIR